MADPFPDFDHLSQTDSTPPTPHEESNFCGNEDLSHDSDAADTVHFNAANQPSLVDLGSQSLDASSVSKQEFVEINFAAGSSSTASGVTDNQTQSSGDSNFEESDSVFKSEIQSLENVPDSPVDEFHLTEQLPLEQRHLLAQFESLSHTQNVAPPNQKLEEFRALIRQMHPYRQQPSFYDPILKSYLVCTALSRLTTSRQFAESVADMCEWFDELGLVDQVRHFTADAWNLIVSGGEYDNTVKLRLCLLIAKVLRQEKKVSEARKFLKTAQQTIDRMSSPLEELQNSIDVVESDLLIEEGEFSSAAALIIQLAEQLQGRHRAELLMKLGSVYTKINDFGMAKVSLQSAHRVLEADCGEHDMMIECEWQLARVMIKSSDEDVDAVLSKLRTTKYAREANKLIFTRLMEQGRLKEAIDVASEESSNAVGEDETKWQLRCATALWSLGTSQDKRKALSLTSKVYDRLSPLRHVKVLEVIHAWGQTKSADDTELIAQFLKSKPHIRQKFNSFSKESPHIVKTSQEYDPGASSTPKAGAHATARVFEAPHQLKRAKLVSDAPNWRQWDFSPKLPSQK